MTFTHWIGSDFLFWTEDEGGEGLVFGEGWGRGRGSGGLGKLDMLIDNEWMDGERINE